MIGFRSKFATEPDSRLTELAERMGAFYESIEDYTVFRGDVVTDYADFWDHIRQAIEARLAVASMCRVLEFGAGRTGFARSLGDLRERVIFVAQDITSQNEEFLRNEADEIHIGELEMMGGSEPFDVIFSTYVWEHLTQPRATLDRCVESLRPGGMLFVCCPRYEFPFRLSPSAGHYGRVSRLALALALMGSRVVTWLTGRPRFWVHLDPAIFHLPWRRDRDAVHWASFGDIRAYARGRYPLRWLRLPAPSNWRGWVRVRLLLMAFALEKPLEAGCELPLEQATPAPTPSLA